MIEIAFCLVGVGLVSVIMHLCRQPQIFGYLLGGMRYVWYLPEVFCSPLRGEVRRWVEVERESAKLTFVVQSPRLYYRVTFVL